MGYYSQIHKWEINPKLVRVSKKTGDIAMKNSYLVLIVLLISACAHTVQTTSGSEYLKNYNSSFEHPNYSSNDDDRKDFKKQLIETASIEPILRFPARIGLARIDQGQISVLSEEEVGAWKITKENLGNSFGEFIPISPLIAAMASSEHVKNDGTKQINQLMNKLRLAAAKQHLDALLVYELFSSSSTQSNILSIMNISIIGGYIFPSNEINAKGIANAMLIDVIQGYPYGTAQTKVDESEYSTLWGEWENSNQLNNKVKIAAAVKLTKEVEEMFKKLRWELAERRTSSYQ